MMHTLAIGAGIDHAFPDGADILVLPGETAPEGVLAHPVNTVKDAVDFIRNRYDHQEKIPSIGSLKVMDDHPTPAAELRAQWLPAIYQQFESIVDELGNCATDSWIGARNILKQGRFLELGWNLADLRDSMVGHPAICLAAGPTAEPQLQRVRDLWTGAAIFTVDAMAHACKKHTIPADFTCMVERIEGNFRMIEGDNPFRGTLIAPPVVDPRNVDAFHGQVFWWLGPDILYQWLKPGCEYAYSGRSSGIISVAAALYAGCDPIFLVGHDLAYAGSKSHAESVHPNAPPEHSLPNNTPAHIHHLRRYQVPGSRGGTVETCGIFNDFRYDLECILRGYPSRRVVNCGGLSHIEGTEIGELPSDLPGIEIRVLERRPKDPIRDWSGEIPRIRQNIAKVMDRCRGVIVGLHQQNPPSELAESLAMSSIVDSDLVILFNYVFRPINMNLSLRMQHQRRHGKSEAAALRSALCKSSVAIYKLCERMEADLANS